MHLTKAETAAILDRLALRDCLIEVLSDEGGIADAAYGATIDSLLNYVRSFARAPVILDALDRRALVECIEGSTYAAQAIDNPHLQAARLRTLHNVAAKLIEAGCIGPINVPAT